MTAPHLPLSHVALAGTLRGCQLFSGLPVEDIETIAGFAKLLRVEKGEYLFRENTPSQGFYVVQTGAINVHRVSQSGREQVIHVFRSGDTFAEASLATPTGYPADARAVENSSILLIPKREFLDLLARRPDLALRMLASMSTHLRVLVGLVEDLQMKDVETRLAHWILQRTQASGTDEVKLQTTKRVLAAEMSTSSETLSRTFAKFRDAGWIRVKGKQISVLDRSGLETIVRRTLGS